MTGTPLDDLTDDQIIDQVRRINSRRMWADRADAARISAWSLLLLSAVALGATLACVDDRDPLGFVFALVTLLLAHASGSERAEMRACRAEAQR